MTPAPPAGYLCVTAGRYRVIALHAHEHDARALLSDGTLYEAAARDLAARPLAGRGIAYAISLPATRTRAVVRHNRHGGVFAPLTRDLFLPHTRAPHELAMSLRLAAAGVPTPEVLMYGVETVGLLFRRSDMVTRAVEGSQDLSAYMTRDGNAATRAQAWAATRALLAALGDAGARHHDLNVKNVLLATVPADGALRAWVLDVDRVEFTDPLTARAGNAARLLRSARKWRDEHGAAFTEGEHL